jgi:murein DD-endopeptidase MepM/ murein hydrolase activator NlpD
MAQPEQPLQIDFDWAGSVPQELRQPVMDALQAQRSLAPDARLTATALRTVEGWVELILVPAAVVESGWEDGPGKDDLLRVFLHRAGDGWKAWLHGADDFAAVQAQIPAALYDFSTPESHGFLFPWRAGFYWTVGSQGWHGNPANAIDFSPDVEEDDLVIAADGGTVTMYCGPGAAVNDPFQASLQIVHHDGTSTNYVHLDANSIDPGILGQVIPRGWLLGRLYDGAAMTWNGCPSGWTCQFDTRCGYGTGPHLHFAISDITAFVNGVSIFVVGNSPGSSWLSSNNLVLPCSPPGSGNWTVSADCIMTEVDSAPGNVTVQNGALLTLFPAARLNMDFINHALRVENGSGVRIIGGARIE